MKLKPTVLRHEPPTPEQIQAIKRTPIVFVLDEILDTFNIGSLFRLADAVAIEKLYLCGNMEFPPSSRIHKAAVGTEGWVPWEKADSALEVVTRLKSLGYYTLAVEQDSRSISYKDLDCPFPVALILGHETKGVSPEVMSVVDGIVEIPMLGINTSFNVWGTAAVISYKLLERL
jgi:tRNA G18 (ribose-2'-O)-methylase SpoU